MIAGTTALNVSGTKLLARVAMFGFICELLGAIVVGSYLLTVARHQDFHVLFQSFGLGNGHYLPAFLASSVAAMFCYYGFEACGDVAEEDPDASRAIPKAMRMTIYIGGFAAMLVCLALVLAIPNLNAVLSGQDADPVASTLRAAVGDIGLRAVIAVVLVSSLLLPRRSGGGHQPFVVQLWARSHDRWRRPPEQAFRTHAGSGQRLAGCRYVSRP